MNKKIFKKSVLEAKFMASVDDLGNLKGKLEDTDIVKIVDETTELTENDEVCDPELNGDDYEDLKKTVQESRISFSESIGKDGREKILISKKDFNKLNENKKWL